MSIALKSPLEFVCLCSIRPHRGFSNGSAGKNPPARQKAQETQVQSLGWEDLLEEEMTTHSSILAWEIPWTEEPGELPPMGPQSQTQRSD